jgi:hypothetical protein
VIARERYKPNIEAGRPWTAPCENFVLTANMLKMFIVLSFCGGDIRGNISQRPDKLLQGDEGIRK